jgi:hypothetical protein
VGTRQDKVWEAREAYPSPGFIREGTVPHLGVGDTLGQSADVTVETCAGRGEMVSCTESRPVNGGAEDVYQEPPL